MTVPAVSICCITYNHAKYIRDALEGFLMQKTNFPIEILIHDDASTDGTADIIREYEAKHPDIIKPIYQTENQYSQGKDVSSFNFNRVQGKYIALCEGDDFWTDPNKLQIQYDFMESHPDYSMCFHNARIIDYLKGASSIRFDPNGENREIPAKEFMTSFFEGIFTHSLFFKMDILNFLADYQKHLSVGDAAIHACAIAKGKVFFFTQILGCYRWRTPGSWTGKCSMEKFEASRLEMYHYLCYLEDNDLLSGEIIYEKKCNTKFDYLFLQKRFFAILFSTECIHFLSRKSLVARISLFLQILKIRKQKYMVTK